MLFQKGQKLSVLKAMSVELSYIFIFRNDEENDLSLITVDKNSS